MCDDFWSRPTNEREGCRVESRVDSSARNALSRETRNASVLAAGSARVFLQKARLAFLCSLFSLSTDDDDDGGVGGWFSYLKFFGEEDHYLDDVACLAVTR